MTDAANEPSRPIAELRAAAHDVLAQFLATLGPTQDPPPLALFALPATSSLVGIPLMSIPGFTENPPSALPVLRHVADDLGAPALVVILPAWMSLTATGHEATVTGRREVVIVTIESREDAGGAGVYPLERTTHAPPTVGMPQWIDARSPQRVLARPWLGALQGEPPALESAKAIGIVSALLQAVRDQVAPPTRH